MSYQENKNLNKKKNSQSILIVVVKWRHQKPIVSIPCKNKQNFGIFVLRPYLATFPSRARTRPILQNEAAEQNGAKTEHNNVIQLFLMMFKIKLS
jgi:hypothetical protein